MAAAEPSPLSSQTSKRKRNRNPLRQDPDLERLDSLPWNPALPDDDNFSAVIGTNELEGGSASLIDLIDFSVSYIFWESKQSIRV